jgi:hypothetical protein
MPRGRGADEQQREVELWRASGLTAERFCARRGYSPKSLFRWAAAARSAVVMRPTEFVRLEVASTPGVAGLVVEVGVGRIRVERGFDRELLRDVVAALAAGLT